MYGRVIHLNPVKWTEGWPVIGEDKDGDGCGEPVRRYRKPNVGKTYPVETPAESDEFNSRRLGLQWEWHANYQDAFGFTSDLGYMRIYGHVLSEDFVNFWEVPNLLLQKFPAEDSRLRQTESIRQNGRTAIGTYRNGLGLQLYRCGKGR